MKSTLNTFYLIVSFVVFTFQQILAISPSELFAYYAEVNTITDDCLIQTCTLEWEIQYCDVDDNHKTSAIPLQDEHFCLRLCLFHLASLSKNKDLKAIFRTYQMDEKSHKKHSCYEFKRLSAEAEGPPPPEDDKTAGTSEAPDHTKEPDLSTDGAGPTDGPQPPDGTGPTDGPEPPDGTKPTEGAEPNDKPTEAGKLLETPQPTEVTELAKTPEHTTSSKPDNALINVKP